MKFLAAIIVLVDAVASVFGQTIELGTPTDGTVLVPGQNFTSQIVQPESLASCIQVGIALAIANCDSSTGVCPQPSVQLGDVLYAGPWVPTVHNPGGFYQNFTVQIPEYISSGPAVFTLTHLCLLGAAPYPFLEFRNATVTIQ